MEAIHNATEFFSCETDELEPQLLVVERDPEVVGSRITDAVLAFLGQLFAEQGINEVGALDEKFEQELAAWYNPEKVNTELRWIG